MEKLKKKNRGLWILIGLLLAAIAAVIIAAAVTKPKPGLPAVVPRPTPEIIVREKEVEKLVETEKVVTAAVIEDGLRDMGKLVTEEYFFTEVVTFSSIKSYLKVEWKITESSFLASYDGVINAGIDFAGIGVVKDEEHKTVTVTLPAAEILAVDVDPDSLTVYSEKNGLGNHITVEDYSSALSVLEQNATAKALDKGILEKAEQNAERLIRPFIGSLVDLNEYSLRFERAA